jgi:hypothetical protein
MSKYDSAGSYTSRREPREHMTERIRFISKVICCKNQKWNPAKPRI